MMYFLPSVRLAAGSLNHTFLNIRNKGLKLIHSPHPEPLIIVRPPFPWTSLPTLNIHLYNFNINPAFCSFELVIPFVFPICKLNITYLSNRLTWFISWLPVPSCEACLFSNIYIWIFNFLVYCSAFINFFNNLSFIVSFHKRIWGIRLIPLQRNSFI